MPQIHQLDPQGRPNHRPLMTVDYASGARFDPYPAGWRLDALRAAFRWIESRVVGCGTCNAAFLGMLTEDVRARTFDAVWRDNLVWVSYDPVHVRGRQYGYTMARQDVTVTEHAFLAGWRMVAATLIHELGHVNGASLRDHEAERMLLGCRMADLHNPAILGSLRGRPGAATARLA